VRTHCGATREPEHRNEPPSTNAAYGAPPAGTLDPPMIAAVGGCAAADETTAKLTASAQSKLNRWGKRITA
jgi:hypothetical protein